MIRDLSSHLNYNFLADFLAPLDKRKRLRRFMNSIFFALLLYNYQSGAFYVNECRWLEFQLCLLLRSFPRY